MYYLLTLSMINHKNQFQSWGTGLWVVKVDGKGWSPGSSIPFGSRVLLPEEWRTDRIQPAESG
jgi:hypothetical protein